MSDLIDRQKAIKTLKMLSDGETDAARLSKRMMDHLRLAPGTEMNDLIDRNEAIKAIQKEIYALRPPYVDDTIRTIRYGLRVARGIIEDLAITEKEGKE